MSLLTRAAQPAAYSGAPRPPLGRRLAALTGSGVLQGIMLLIGLFWLIPTAGLFVSSFRSADDISSSGWWTVFTHPAQLTIADYTAVLHDQSIIRSLVNTVLITVPATVLVVILAALAAHAFAWMQFPGRDWMFVGVVGLLVVPIQVALIPVAKLYKYTHMFGSISGVVLFHVGFGLPFAIFLLRNFFAGLPKDLFESAKIDGANEITVFYKIVIQIGRAHV